MLATAPRAGKECDAGILSTRQQVRSDRSRGAGRTLIALIGRLRLRGLSNNRTAKMQAINEHHPDELCMPAAEPNTEQLAAYLDEALPAAEMTAMEKQLRASESLRHRLSAVSRRRDQGVHSVGEIWRRNRLSCPSRKLLGSYLLGTAERGLEQYIEFHIRTVGCRVCAANLHDLEEQKSAAKDSSTRRRKFFQSSAGLLRSKGLKNEN